MTRSFEIITHTHASRTSQITEITKRTDAAFVSIGIWRWSASERKCIWFGKLFNRDKIGVIDFIADGGKRTRSGRIVEWGRTRETAESPACWEIRKPLFNHSAIHRFVIGVQIKEKEKESSSHFIIIFFRGRYRCDYRRDATTVSPGRSSRRCNH